MLVAGAALKTAAQTHSAEIAGSPRRSISTRCEVSNAGVHGHSIPFHLPFHCVQHGAVRTWRVTHAGVDIFDRPDAWFIVALWHFARALPVLRIVFQHITTRGRRSS